ncbi:hypothetical protein FRC09_014226 [Ceratobasidium sp. 395]|nr:hypothetical protein FRC09_014226 [Ceratobasidium sp. 395]
MFDNASTSKVFQHIAQECPNISQLEFCCELDELADGNNTEDSSLRTFASLSTGFQNLWSLVSSPVIIQSSALQMLARLPNLTNLWIRAQSDTTPWNSSLCEQLPPSSFPALKSLRIDLETCRDVKRFWELIPLANLEWATVSIASTSEVGDEFIPTLCRASPHLKSLGLEFSSQSDLDEDGEIHMVPLNTFEHLARLPLKLRKARFRKRVGQNRGSVAFFDGDQLFSPAHAPGRTLALIESSSTLGQDRM